MIRWIRDIVVIENKKCFLPGAFAAQTGSILMMAGSLFIWQVPCFYLVRDVSLSGKRHVFIW